MRNVRYSLGVAAKSLPDAPAAAPKRIGPEMPPRQRQTGRPSLEEVRDAVLEARDKGPIAASAIALAMNADQGHVRRHLVTLKEKGMLAEPDPKDGTFVYVRPVSMGAAARIDQQRRPREEPVHNGNGGPVAGTGKRPVVTNPEVRQLISAAMKAGAPQPQLVPSGHWEVQCPNGKRVLISNTPSGARTVANDRVRLRREGLAV